VLFKEKYQININEKDSKLKTPLHYCAINKNYEILNILINYENIDINCRDNNGNTPLHYSIDTDHQRAIKKLITMLI
jgi:ankyrin repeat protein